MIPWFYHSMNVLHFTLLAHIGGKRFSICGTESISRTAVKTHFFHHLLSLVKATLGWDSKQVERIRSRGPHHSDVGLLWGRRFFSSPSINSTHHGACMFSQAVTKRLLPPGWGSHISCSRSSWGRGAWGWCCSASWQRQQFAGNVQSHKSSWEPFPFGKVAVFTFTNQRHVQASEKWLFFFNKGLIVVGTCDMVVCGADVSRTFLY